MSNFKKKHPAGAYVRDVHLAYLIKGARRTKGEGYPIIEGWMIAKHPPQTVRKRAFFNALAVLMNSFSNEIARRFAISFQK